MVQVIKEQETRLGTLLIAQVSARHSEEAEDFGYNEWYTSKQWVLLMESGTEYTRANAKNVIQKFGCRVMLENGYGERWDDLWWMTLNCPRQIWIVDPQSFISKLFADALTAIATNALLPPPKVPWPWERVTARRCEPEN